MNIDALLSKEQARGTLEYLDRYRKPDVAGLSEFGAVTTATFARSCILTGRTGAADIARAREEAEELAQQINSHPRPEELELDPILLIEYFKSLKAVNADTPAFRNLAGTVAEHFAKAKGAMAKESRMLRLERLLADVGIGPSPTKINRAFKECGEMLLEPSEKIAARVDLAIASGENPSPQVAELLAILALAELRDYRIDFATHILRFLVSSDHIDGFVTEGISFVALQRTREGSYGFFDPLNEQNIDERQRDSAFRLPVTLNAIWLIKLFSQKMQQKTGSMS